jgi:AraC family transcriptional regulator
MVEQLKIISLEPSFFIGKNSKMSLSKDATFLLWNSFMPYLKNVEKRKGKDFYSIIIYPENYFESFNPSLEFENWAAVQVDSDAPCINGLDFLEFSGGKYLQFMHVGSMDKFKDTMFQLYSYVIPNSEYILDSRPHITIMSDRYNPQSEFLKKKSSYL